jgi:hypothetical protein
MKFFSPMKAQHSFHFRFAASLLLLVLLSTACLRGTEEQRKRQSLPDFKFEGIDGAEIGRKDLPAGQPVTILYFDPDCSHCKTTVESVSRKIDAFESSQNTIVMVSSADRSRVIPLLSEFQLLKHPAVKVALCEPQQFLETFGTTETPTMLFYAGDFDLKMAYKGAVNMPGIDDGLKAVAGK